MRQFNSIIEFVTKHNKRFYNRDIKCPVCGETMWFDDSQLETNILHLVCHNDCCTMGIEYERHILWDDKI